YVNALRKANIDVDPDLRIPGPRSMQGGFEAAVHLLSLPQKPTAVVCWNDLVAIGMMNGIARAGLVPGRDVSVTGYDDLEEASIATPALTTVWNGQSDVGRSAARALLDKLNGSHEPDGIHLIKPEMRIRQSTGPLRPNPTE
ncbi:MAG: transcriptional regulator, partial [Hyphomicrobiales bacterium]